MFTGFEDGPTPAWSILLIERHIHQNPQALFILPSTILGAFTFLDTAEGQERSSEKIVIKTLTGCSTPCCYGK